MAQSGAEVSSCPPGHPGEFTPPGVSTPNLARLDRCYFNAGPPTRPTQLPTTLDLAPGIAAPLYDPAAQLSALSCFHWLFCHNSDRGLARVMEAVRCYLNSSYTLFLALGRWRTGIRNPAYIPAYV